MNVPYSSRLFAGETTELPLPPRPPDLAGYVDLAVCGGYPPVVGLDDEARGIWLRSYVEQLVLRDIPELGEIRDPAGLRRLLRAIAEHTAGLVADTELAAAADINVKTRVKALRCRPKSATPPSHCPASEYGTHFSAFGQSPLVVHPLAVGFAVSRLVVNRVHPVRRLAGGRCGGQSLH